MIHCGQPGSAGHAFKRAKHTGAPILSRDPVGIRLPQNGRPGESGEGWTLSRTWKVGGYVLPKALPTVREQCCAQNAAGHGDAEHDNSRVGAVGDVGRHHFTLLEPSALQPRRERRRQRQGMRGQVTKNDGQDMVVGGPKLFENIGGLAHGCMQASRGGKRAGGGRFSSW
jgi:hypothetical protein